jgi:adenosylcobyric acid synthase
MLGQTIDDPHGIEGEAGASNALGWLEMQTTLNRDKRLEQVTGTCTFADAGVAGYEIHMGISSGAALAHPAFLIDGRPEGALSNDGQILGTYLHGVFDTPQACRALLQWAGLDSDTTLDASLLREQSLDRIADAARPLMAALKKLPPFA